MIASDRCQEYLQHRGPQCKPLYPDHGYIRYTGINRDINKDVDVDLDSYFGCFKGAWKVSLGTRGGKEAVMVLTLIFLKWQALFLAGKGPILYSNLLYHTVVLYYIIPYHNIPVGDQSRGKLPG